MTDITIIGGENPVFIKEELDKINSSFAQNDKTIYYGDELNNDDFFSDLNTGSLFCAKKMFLVKHADHAKGDFEKLLLHYLQAPSDIVYLVLEYGKIPTKILNAANKLGNKIVTIYNFKKAWVSDQKQYAQRKLQDKNIKFSREMLDLLVEYAGEDIEELSGMLDRLINYLGDKKTLNTEDIKFVLERAKNGSIFDLLDAIFQRNKAKALQSYYDLQEGGESFPAINALFLRATRIMWAIKTSRDGQPPQGFAVSPYEWKKYQNFARGINLRFLSKCLGCMSELEFESKTRPEIFAQVKFEQFLCTL